MQREVEDKAGQVASLDTSVHVLKQMMETLKERNTRLERDKTQEAVEAERLLSELSARRAKLDQDEAHVVAVSSNLLRLQTQLRERIADAGLEQWAQAASLAATVPALQSELERTMKQLAADKARVQELEQWIGTNINMLYPRLAQQVNAAIERGDAAFRLPVFWTEIDFAAL